VQLPIVFERTLEGKSIQVEINMVESTPEYRELDVWASGGGLSAYFPSGKGFVVKKEG
jgi:hypothetical protein